MCFCIFETKTAKFSREWCQRCIDLLLCSRLLLKAGKPVCPYLSCIYQCLYLNHCYRHHPLTLILKTHLGKVSAFRSPHLLQLQNQPLSQLILSLILWILYSYLWTKVLKKELSQHMISIEAAYGRRFKMSSCWKGILMQNSSSSF